MIQTPTFDMSKRKARLSLGPDSKNSFVYWSDVKRQWESSYSSSKVVELIGSQSVPAFNLPDVQKWLGDLSTSEQEFSKKFTSFYKNIVNLLTTVPVPVLSECDLAETLLDMRIMRQHIKFPCRILDIGPGAGRHQVNMFLLPECHNNVYVGIESIGLPYSIQNIIASSICLQDRSAKFYEYVDYESERIEFPMIDALSANAIIHLPLWKADLLPKKYFDLIICNYVLDEVPVDDFNGIVEIIGNCLADEGVVHCRGSQHRARLKDMYLYGCGAFHGQDITKALISKDLKVKYCEVIASQLTRLFVRKTSKTHLGTGGKYASYEEDLPLLEEIQKDYITANLKELEESRKKVLVWGDIDGYGQYMKHIMPYQGKINIIGMTHRFASKRAATGFGIMEYPPSEFVSLSPDVVIIASMRDLSILRQIREMSSPEEFKLVRKFNFPVAIAYRSVK